MAEPQPVWDDTGSDENNSDAETEAEDDDEEEEKKDDEETKTDVKEDPEKSNANKDSDNWLSRFIEGTIETLHPETKSPPKIDEREAAQRFYNDLTQDRERRIEYFENTNIYERRQKTNEAEEDTYVTEYVEEPKTLEEDEKIIEKEILIEEDDELTNQTSEETFNFEEVNSDYDVDNKSGFDITKSEYYEEYVSYIKKDNSWLTEKDLEMLEFLDGKDGVPDPYAFSPLDLTNHVTIGDENWQAMMDKITYTSPFEDYVPLESKPPHEAIWEKWDRLDYNEGRYVDESEFDDPSLPTDLQVDVEEIKRLAKLLEEGKPIPYDF